MSAHNGRCVGGLRRVHSMFLEHDFVLVRIKLDWTVRLCETESCQHTMEARWWVDGLSESGPSHAECLTRESHGSCSSFPACFASQPGANLSICEFGNDPDYMCNRGHFLAFATEFANVADYMQIWHGMISQICSPSEMRWFQTHSQAINNHSLLGAK